MVQGTQNPLSQRKLTHCPLLLCSVHLILSRCDHQMGAEWEDRSCSSWTQAAMHFSGMPWYNVGSHPAFLSFSPGSLCGLAGCSGIEDSHSSDLCRYLSTCRDVCWEPAGIFTTFSGRTTGLYNVWHTIVDEHANSNEHAKLKMDIEATVFAGFLACSSRTHSMVLYQHTHTELQKYASTPSPFLKSFSWPFSTCKIHCITGINVEQVGLIAKTLCPFVVGNVVSILTTAKCMYVLPFTVDRGMLTACVTNKNPGFHLIFSHLRSALNIVPCSQF